MKIGIMGAGNVGGTLGVRWAEAGHELIFGSRHPDSDEQRELVSRAGRTARAATIPEALAGSEVLLLATPWPATKDVVTACGDFGGKVLIDATNAIRADFSGIEYGPTTSAAEQVAQWARNARVVKAFNTIGSNIMAKPPFGNDKPVLFYCGDDKNAKQTVHKLAAALGFDPHDAGALDQARVLEPFAMLWISLALKYGYGREIAFKFLRR
jgi:8-hydroxy-5-deazaflavin:NADPH oxidoreductase